ncbi:MAG: GNAT family N-acetyltransferase [Bacteroidota bacterium]|jgi:ribosomal protein S18 acetylase RimI-like enzyme|nr:GNAT family N-acetyltransferase [Cytophagales bacterium]
MEYIIRECAEKDLPKIVELCSKHSEFEKAKYDPTGKVTLLKKALFSERPKLFCSVIESSKKLQGYFSYTFDYSTWDAQTFLYLDCLYLEPEFRGQRIGKIVFENLREIAKQNECVNIQWQTPIFNERAINFYNRIGGTGKEKVRFFIDINQTDDKPK